jgi:hypothetical protein
MIERVIPDFAQRLRTHYSDTNSDNLRHFTLDRLILELHDAGINLRHIGLVKKVKT